MDNQQLYHSLSRMLAPYPTCWRLPNSYGLTDTVWPPAPLLPQFMNPLSYSLPPMTASSGAPPPIRTQTGLLSNHFMQEKKHKPFKHNTCNSHNSSNNNNYNNINNNNNNHNSHGGSGHAKRMPMKTKASRSKSVVMEEVEEHYSTSSSSDHHSPPSQFTQSSEVEKSQERQNNSKGDDGLTSAPVTGIRILNDDEIGMRVITAGDIDERICHVKITPQARERLARIENRIGDFICRLCRVKYADAFALAQHSCPRIVHIQYQCTLCDKLFNCPANLASHRRWHKPKKTADLPEGEQKAFSNNSFSIANLLKD